MAMADLVEHRDRAQPGSVLQHRRDLAVPDRGQWVRATATARHFLL